MVNNGIVVAMVVGVGGMVSGETVVSGDTQFYPEKVLEVAAMENESLTSRLLPFLGRLAANSSSDISGEFIADAI